MPDRKCLRKWRTRLANLGLRLAPKTDVPAQWTARKGPYQFVGKRNANQKEDLWFGDNRTDPVTGLPKRNLIERPYPAVVPKPSPNALSSESQGALARHKRHPIRNPTMKALRTPDSRFEGLDGYPFEPHYIDVTNPDGGESLRMHYIDEGPRDGKLVMLLHGEPTWSYLYRKMIPGLVKAGHRVIAPDQIGFGRSDKPTEQSDYSVARHVAWIRECIVKLDVQDATFFGQDWGSLIGFTAVLHEESRFRAIVAANAALPDPSNMDRMAAALTGSKDSEAFSRWQDWAAAQDHMDVGKSLAEGLAGVGMGGSMDLSQAEIDAYDSPFPDASYQAGVLVFPSLIQPEKLIPDGLALFNEAWRVLEKWEKPFVTAYGLADPVLGWFAPVFQQYVPGAKGQPHREFPNGPHFIQEAEADALVETILAAATA